MPATPPPVLIVVAHPDDETFGTGSVIATLAARGHDVTVCCATRGEAGERPDWLAEDQAIGDVREAELRTAGALLGVRRFVLLGFTDSGMDGDPAPGTLAAAPLEAVVDAVGGVLDDVRPGIVVTLDPDHGDGHRDHVAIGRATTLACASRSGLRLYYWVILRTLLQRWFDEIARVRPDTGHLDLDRAGLGRPEADVTTTVDVSGLREVRERATAAHASQVAPYEGMPVDLRDAVLDVDRLIRVQPPLAPGETDELGG